MAGKGDTRRPRQVSRDEYERRWEETFGGEKKDDRHQVGEFFNMPVIADPDMPKHEIEVVGPTKVVRMKITREVLDEVDELTDPEKLREAMERKIEEMERGLVRALGLPFSALKSGGVTGATLRGSIEEFRRRVGLGLRPPDVDIRANTPESPEKAKGAAGGESP